MEKIIRLPEDNVEEAIIAIGKSLIKRAKDVANDVDKVSSITIYANIVAGEVVNFDITKNYTATFNKNEEDK